MLPNYILVLSSEHVLEIATESTAVLQSVICTCLVLLSAMMCLIAGHVAILQLLDMPRHQVHQYYMIVTAEPIIMLLYAALDDDSVIYLLNSFLHHIAWAVLPVTSQNRGNNMAHISTAVTPAGQQQKLLSI